MAVAKGGTRAPKNSATLMAKEISQRKSTMQYKRADFTHPKTADLQSLVAAAVSKLGSVHNREQVNSLDSTTTVLSGVHTSNSMLVGKLMLYTPGQHQKYLELDPVSGDYKLGSVPVASGAVGPREFVESILYFAVFGNHVMFLGSTSLRSSHLEKHLNWLLREAQVVVAGNYLFLADQQSESAANRVARAHVKSIEIGGEVEFKEVERVDTLRKTKNRETTPGYKFLSPTGPLADAVTQIFGPIFADASLKAPLKQKTHVGFKMVLDYRNRKKTKEGLELMDSLAIAGRHFDENTCVVNLEGGGKLKGQDIKVSKPMSFRAHPDGRFIEPQVWIELNEWLVGAIEGKVVGA
ncbi:hypothetical protein [Xanthomonas arboricola]|uniref:hypothetical protein n=1 Tax=Xanthomonas arboricola TaxID=56448 RepID=UPI00142FBA8C|nr:hypothetical protein [Xanthomonas arboricola]NJB93177.1 hypothetical protein [Xanthomonas arboricola]